MAIEYKWEILSLYTAPSEDGLENVVKKINWRFQATDGQFYGDQYQVTELSAPSADGYIAYDSLTEETIVGWIKANEDYDQIKANVESKLEANKTPSIVEKDPPWYAPVAVTGEERYLVVIDDEPNDLDKIWGPLKWNSKKINDGIKQRGITDVEVPEDIIVFRKGLYPVNEPLVLDDRVKIYKVDYEPQPSFDQLTQYNEGQTWVTDTGVAVGTYIVKNYTVDEIKEKFKQIAVEIRMGRMNEDLTISLNGEQFTVKANEPNLLLAATKASLMAESDTVSWKLSDTWVDVDKAGLESIAKFISDKLETYYDEEKEYNLQIDACTTVDELKALYDATK